LNLLLYDFFNFPFPYYSRKIGIVNAKIKDIGILFAKILIIMKKIFEKKNLVYFGRAVARY